MFYWLLERILRRGFKSRRGIIGLGQMDNLARSGTAAWSLAQERARLDYLAAKEEYEKLRTWRSFERLMERLLQLHSTNALVQSLLNEHALEQLQMKAQKDAEPQEPPAARRCA
jgi:hypothetical protein